MIRSRLLLGALLSLLAGGPVGAAVVQSDRIEAVSVTLYRGSDQAGGAIDPHWPGGYALVTETRRVTIPAGEAVIRFQGVAEGMLPETAIVTGLPQAVREKNRDARLLSPASLVDAHLKRRVHLRRTNRATGQVREEEAVIQSGPMGGVVVETASGVEALGCSGFPETLKYDGVPDGLFARPTLSVLTEADRATTVTVRLSYLAQGLDWAANYVAQIAPDGESLDLFAWLTIANGGSQGFIDASTQAVAGELNRQANRDRPSQPQAQLTLQCWPMDGTSTHPRLRMDVPPPPPPAAGVPMEAYDDIIVTAMKREEKLMAVAMPLVAMSATQEELGDLKLYRIPEAVTVAAQSRKQVAMIDKHGVRFERVYRASTEDDETENEPMQILLRTKNLRERGLGLPLPAGNVAIFEPVNGAPMLAGEASLSDRAVGDEVELLVGDSPDVRMTVVRGRDDGDVRRFDVEITNARSRPASAEVAIPYQLAGASTKLKRKDGTNLWQVTVPANGTAKLRYRIKLGVPKSDE